MKSKKLGLCELIVLIAVTSLLAAILFPVFAAPKSAATTHKCASCSLAAGTLTTPSADRKEAALDLARFQRELPQEAKDMGAGQANVQNSLVFRTATETTSVYDKSGGHFLVVSVKPGHKTLSVREDIQNDGSMLLTAPDGQSLNIVNGPDGAPKVAESTSGFAPADWRCWANCVGWGLVSCSWPCIRCEITRKWTDCGSCIACIGVLAVNCYRHCNGF